MVKIWEYKAGTGISFEKFFDPNFSEATSPLFKRSPQLLQQMEDCSVIKLSIMAEPNDIPTQELLFRCDGTTDGWFSASNLLDTTSWDLSDPNIFFSWDVSYGKFVLRYKDTCDITGDFFVVSCRDYCEWEIQGDLYWKKIHSEVCQNSGSRNR